MQLAGDQFPGEEEKISWAYSYMKSGQAALFVDRMLCFKAQVGSPRYSIWLKFKSAFIAEFCSKNETQMALAKLETSSYFQGC
jgi:hypothetical protein